MEVKLNYLKLKIEYNLEINESKIIQNKNNIYYLIDGKKLILYNEKDYKKNHLKKIIYKLIFHDHLNFW